MISRQNYASKKTYNGEKTKHKKNMKKRCKSSFPASLKDMKTLMNAIKTEALSAPRFDATTMAAFNFLLLVNLHQSKNIMKNDNCHEKQLSELLESEFFSGQFFLLFIFFIVHFFSF